MIDETLLTKKEAISFLECMYIELHRHKQASQEALVNCLTNINNQVKYRFWHYGRIRHEEDIDMILHTIKYLEEKYDLKPRGI